MMMMIFLHMGGLLSANKTTNDILKTVNVMQIQTEHALEN